MVLTPDQIVLEALFNEYRQAEYPGDSADDVFERYGATQVLKPRELSPEQLSAGIVDGAKDGGIDSFFVFLNSGLLRPDDPRLISGDASVKALGARPELEVFVIQSKNKYTWEESVWEHLLSSLANLLDFNSDEAYLESLYHADVVEQTGIFRKASLSLGSKFPQVTFRLAYVTKGAEGNITESIEQRGAQVEALVKSRLTTGAVVIVDHIGASRLYQLAGNEYSKPATLKFRSLIRQSSAFLGVASLKDYLSFIRDESGALREELFDSNVRDYEGDNTVNEAIAETLAAQPSAEFWWLNNGVTVLSDGVDSPQETLTMSRPLIVNGLQTSHVLHKADQEGLLVPERREDGVVVRVVVTEDDEIRDKIIAGTNRQTLVPTPALYATQPLQRDIERFLLVHDWFYERRKNRYKNLGKPAKRRITMNFLAQSLITLLLARPDDARARPSTLMNRKEVYETIFPESMDRGAYLVAIEIVKAVDEYLTTDKAKAIMEELTNSRFYVAIGYVILSLNLKDINKLNFDKNFQKFKQPLKDTLLTQALEMLKSTAASYQKEHPKASRDSVFKSSDFRDSYFISLGVNL